MAEDGETLIATGVITGPEARGAVEIAQGQDGAINVRISDVWIASGAPDVRIYLSSDPGGDVTTAMTIELGKVTALSGELAYTLAPGTDVANLRSLVVHCTVYSVTFGVAPLELLAA